MKKLIASIFFVISAIAMLNSCSDPSSNSSVNISGDLTWNGGNGNDVDLISIPIGFQNGGTDNATPISIKVSGSILDNGACQDKLIYSDGQDFQFIPGASFTGYRSTQSTPIGLVLGFQEQILYLNVLVCQEL